MPTRTSYEPGTPSWVDLASPDLAASASFYSSVFGWDAKDQGPESGHYHMIELRGIPVAGAGPIMMEGQPPAWTTYVSVTDADASIAKVKAAGGTVFVEPMDVLDVGRMAVFADPTGAAAAVWQPRRHLGRGTGQRARCTGVERTVHPGHRGGEEVLWRGVRLGCRDRRHGRDGVHHVEAERERRRRHDGDAGRGAGRGALLLAGLFRHRRLRCHGGHRHRARGQRSSPDRWTSRPAGSRCWLTRTVRCSG